MALMSRLRVAWSGGSVTGPGLTTFYSSAGVSPADLPGAVLTFFNSVKGIVPIGVTWTVPSSGDVLNDATGELEGVWAESGGGAVSSTGGTAFAAGVGLRIKWVTGGIVAGRRVKGSTFLVPVHSTGLQSDGTWRPDEIDTMGAAAVALLAADPTLGIWSRPTPSRSGSFHPIVGVVTPDAVSWLRSRRT